uniref:Uncharacterized protein n=1 Tax=Oryza glumipatula TaxID=40148 RepID=A0A0E0BNP5_9ORYZ
MVEVEEVSNKMQAQMRLHPAAAAEEEDADLPLPALFDKASHLHSLASSSSLDQEGIRKGVDLLRRCDEMPEGVAIESRKVLLERASQGTTIFVMNKPSWMIETDPKEVGLGIYV